MTVSLDPRAAPLSNHVLFQSDDLDCARERVAQKFCSHRLDVVGNASRFRAAHHHAPGGIISLNYITYGADVLIDPGELEHFYLIQMPIAGAATIRNGCKEFLTDRNTASVLNPDWATRMSWWQGCEQVLIQIKKAPFHALAERILGRALPGPIAFDPEIDLTRPEMAAWRNLANALFQAAGTNDRAAPADLSSALREQQLLEVFLRYQPSNMAPFLAAPGAAVQPGHLRKAEEFIRDKAAEPITVIDIAEAAGVTSRTLQLAYKSAFGISPMNALTRERMRRVRFDLIHGGDVVSVADAALKWGFSHLGRFSSAYRDEFGEFPRDTLRARAA